MSTTSSLVIADNQALVFPLDDRIYLGEGLFETIKIVGQQPCYSFRHWQRMLDGADRLSIPFDVSFNQWQNELGSCVDKTVLQDGGIKVVLSGGSSSRGLCSRADVSRLVFNSFTYCEETIALNLISARWLRDASNPIYQIKSVNYLESILARREAMLLGADDVLFFNIENYATETSVANLFLVHDDKIYTPMLNNGVFAGIIRARILNLCLNEGIICTEKLISSDMIIRSEAVFVTNSLHNIRMVKSFNGYALPIEHQLVRQLQTLLLNDAERFTGDAASF
jgi:4-amino-4-deoxychorismate lyase